MWSFSQRHGFSREHHCSLSTSPALRRSGIWYNIIFSPPCYGALYVNISEEEGEEDTNELIVVFFLFDLRLDNCSRIRWEEEQRGDGEKWKAQPRNKKITLTSSSKRGASYQCIVSADSSCLHRHTSCSLGRRAASPCLFVVPGSSYSSSSSATTLIIHLWYIYIYTFQWDGASSQYM